MCVVSMVGDHYREKWFERPYVKPFTPTVWPDPRRYIPALPPAESVPFTQAEFEELKREVAELKELLKRAKAYDEANGEPDCEIDEKMDFLRKVARLVGVELDDVLATKAARQ